VPLATHGHAILAATAPGVTVNPDALALMAGLCLGNARQFTLICQALQSIGSAAPITQSDIQLLVNAPPVQLLLRLQSAVAARDIQGVTECVLALWGKGYSFEDCIAMLETVVRVYNTELTGELQYVLQVCAEGHIFQILNRMTALDLIAVLSGQASSECLSETVAG
jgi:hypothetical protein